MPELPEVELVARFLDKLLAGRTVEQAQLLRPRLAPFDRPGRFARGLSGAMIDSVVRRGKHILFQLDNGRTLVVHLRMSGRFMIVGSDAEHPKFTHAVFRLSGGQMLLFQDQRHFGFMRLARSNAVTTLPEIRKLAPEPFSIEFSTEYLYDGLKRSKRRLKEFLIDQSKVCGLGNIYAAEAMFLSGLHPAKRANTLSRKRADSLHAGIRSILTEAIEAGSTLNADPTDSDSAYYGGEYERYWRVYDRERLPCFVCGTAIRRMKQGGRSTYFCPRCQRR